MTIFGVDVRRCQEMPIILKQTRIENARKGGPEWSTLRFWSSDDLASDLDVADVVIFFNEMRIRIAG